MNFDQLNLSPLMVLMLLLYGLLIAVVLVIWTALNLRGRKSARTAPAQSALTADPVPPPQHAPEELPRALPAARRAADSDSVESYSVRPRVSAREAPALPRKREEVAAAPAREPIRDPEIDFEVGRSSRQPSGEPPKTVTPVRPPAPRTEQVQPPATAGRRKSEDAFERFLRSSRDDNDDY